MMKHKTFIIFIVGFLIGCNTHEDDIHSETIKIKSESAELIPDSTRNQYSQYYLTDLNLREVADLIVNDSIQPIDNNITFSILDSVTKGNKTTRDYFRAAFDIIIIKSDGALSEVIGLYCISSINENPNELIGWITNGKMEATTESIAGYIVYELKMADNPISKKNKLIKTIENNHQPNESDRSHTDYFIKLIDQAFEKW